jgi:hypothetical protein
MARWVEIFVLCGNNEYDLGNLMIRDGCGQSNSERLSIVSRLVTLVSPKLYDGAATRPKT